MKLTNQEFERVFGRGPQWGDSTTDGDGSILWVSSWDDSAVEFIPDNASYGFEYGEIEAYQDTEASSSSWEEPSSD